eukprot:TRINITY_DN666_c0_g1_i1.p1 TRINITY_DN666_c0_g1~~TRINITY_DN666_c0_g1_i1.p1  ORF type:complete len:236 (-),score=73.86 TRINITY_DN666_c0_g1_i1:798-1505(-)
MSAVSDLQVVSVDIQGTVMDIADLVHVASRNAHELEKRNELVSLENEILRSKLCSTKAEVGDAANGISQVSRDIQLSADMVCAGIHSIQRENELLKAKAQEDERKLKEAQKQLAEMRAVQDSILRLTAALSSSVEAVQYENKVLKSQVSMLEERNAISTSKLREIQMLNYELNQSKDSIALLISALKVVQAPSAEISPVEQKVGVTDDLIILPGLGNKRNKSLRRSQTSVSSVAY